MLHIGAPASGTSTASHGLSMNCPELPESMIAVERYDVGSPFSLLLLSMYRATKIAPGALVPRLKAMPL